jgi:gliding motility-associated-like protein
VSDGSTDTARNAVRTFTKEGFYSASLKVTSPNGCSSEYTLDNAVKAITRNLALSPNVMRPRYNNGGYTKPGDKDNTIFYPFTQGAKAIDLKIYNRWGILLYQSKEIGRGWDGFLKNGEIAGQDSYVYSLEVTFLNGETEKNVGDLTVLH